MKYEKLEAVPLDDKVYFTGIALPPVVGYYCLGANPYTTKLRFTERPSWWHRYWMKTCLGWTWEDRT